MNPAARAAKHLLRLTALIAVLPVLFVVVGALGTKLGLWSWLFGFRTLSIQAAPTTAFIGVFTGLAALYVAAFAGFRRLWPLAAASLLLPLGVILAFHQFRAYAQAVPPIHDVATDWVEPLMFSERLMRLRGPDANPVERDPTFEWDNPMVENWAVRRVAEINARTCPGARPLALAQPPAAAYARVKAAARQAGAVVVTDDPAAGRLEATDESFWFGFKDDLVFRVRAAGQGSRVDVRSVSRVGKSDLGANCARVTRLVEALGQPAGR
jgi:fatty-acyl-CoA synthase